MKKLFLLVLFLFICFNLKGQNSSSNSYSIVYSEFDKGYYILDKGKKIALKISYSKESSFFYSGGSIIQPADLYIYNSKKITTNLEYKDIFNYSYNENEIKKIKRYVIKLYEIYYNILKNNKINKDNITTTSIDELYFNFTKNGIIVSFDGSFKKNDKEIFLNYNFLENLYAAFSKKTSTDDVIYSITKKYEKVSIDTDRESTIALVELIDRGVIFNFN